MTPVVGVAVIVGLLVAWVIGRQTANKIKKRRQLRHKRRAPVRVAVKRKTKRSEMRAGEDPTTVAGEMNTTTRPGADQSPRE